MIWPLFVPADKPEKWDAADAVAEGLDIPAFIAECTENKPASGSAILAYTVGHFLDDKSPMPEDLNVFIGDAAVRQGLADCIGSFEKLLSEISGNPVSEPSPHSINPN